MRDLTNYKIKILSILKLSWQSQYAIANPRPYHAISMRKRGDASFTVGDESYHVGENDIIYIPKGRGYTLESTKDETVLVIHFDIIDEGEERFEIETFTPENPTMLIDFFERMYNTFHKRGAGYEYKLHSLFYDLLASIEVQKEEIKSHRKRGIADILEYIGSSFTSPHLTVDYIAKTFGISTVYLRRLFAENLGTTPLKYLNDIRIQYASTLLSIGYYSVKEVAEMSGFQDVKYFSTAFKKHTGMRPIEKKNS